MEYKRDSRVIKAFGKHLKKIRKELGVSQEELGYRTGLELSQIGRIERGVINTSISNVFLIADALQIEPKELFDFNYKES